MMGRRCVNSFTSCRNSYTPKASDTRTSRLRVHGLPKANGGNSGDKHWPGQPIYRQRKSKIFTNAPQREMSPSPARHCVRNRFQLATTTPFTNCAISIPKYSWILIWTTCPRVRHWMLFGMGGWQSSKEQMVQGQKSAKIFSHAPRDWCSRCRWLARA
jgi:hypothetical protein